MPQFLLDTRTVSAAVWKKPDPGILAQPREHGGECAILDRSAAARGPGTFPVGAGP